MPNNSAHGLRKVRACIQASNENIVEFEARLKEFQEKQAAFNAQVESYNKEAQAHNERLNKKP